MARRDDVHAVLGGIPPRLVVASGRDRLTFVAFALAIGAAAGWHWPGLSAWWLLGGAAACAIIVLLCGLRLRPYIATALLLLGVMLFGAAWPIAKHFAVASNDLSRFVSQESSLARLRGVVASTPQKRQPAGGSMAAFNVQTPWLVFELDAKALVDRQGEVHPAAGGVWVHAPSGMPWIMPGDVVEVTGWLRAPPRPQNPGEFDMWRFARAHGQPATMSVDNPQLVRVIMSSPTPELWITRWRDELRRKANAWLQADMPESSTDTQQEAVLRAILIGERAPELHEVGAAMQRTGLAHLMAISGLHLGILVGLFLLALGAAREPKRWHGAAAFILIIVYLLLVEVRVPVLRAGVMLGAASLGIMLKRRVAIGGLISLSMIVLVLISPAEVATAGFQLSFGVVYGLIYLAPPMRERWFGRQNMIVGPSGEMLGEWMKSAVTVAVVAWMVATPIVLHHFGILSPLGAPLSLIGVPMAALVLGLGYSKILLSAVLPSAGLIVGAGLAWLTDLLVGIVLWIDHIPGVSIAMPMPSAAWTVLAVAWVVLIVRVRERKKARWVWVGGAALALWLVWPALPVHAEPSLRVDMLDVGDGSCYVLRSGGEVMVFDAGSLGDSGAGARIVVPALRRLGVRHVDVLMVSHANLDHFSAMLEIADAFGGDALLVTPQFMNDAQNIASPMAALVNGMRERGADVEVVSRGEKRTVGEIEMTWIHPPPERTFETVNDSAMVIRITCAGRSVLLCGDIQTEAMQTIAESEDMEALHADVMELPHHGSFRDEAVKFVSAIHPDIVLQSTGYGRLRRDRWADVLADSERLITARDGACWVEIGADGSLKTGRFAQNGGAAQSTE